MVRARMMPEIDSDSCTAARSPIEIVVEPTGMAALSVVISLLAASAVSAAGAVGHQASRRIVVPAALVVHVLARTVPPRHG